MTPDAVTKKHVVANPGGFDFELSDREMQRIREIEPLFPYRGNRQDGYIHLERGVLGTFIPDTLPIGSSEHQPSIEEVPSASASRSRTLVETISPTGERYLCYTCFLNFAGRPLHYRLYFTKLSLQL